MARARSSALVGTSRHALGLVALAPASATAGPCGPGAPGSGGPATRYTPSCWGTAAVVLHGPRGRAEAAGNPEFGGSGVSFWSQPSWVLKGRVPPAGGRLRGSGEWGRAGRPLGCASVLRAGPGSCQHSWKAPCARVSRGVASRLRPLPPPSWIPSAPAVLGRAVCVEAGTGVTGHAAGAAALSLPTPGECTSEAGGPAAAFANGGRFYSLGTLQKLP